MVSLSNHERLRSSFDTLRTSVDGVRQSKPIAHNHDQKISRFSTFWTPRESDVPPTGMMLIGTPPFA